jgi:pyrroline-5-carboxylate reductase
VLATDGGSGRAAALVAELGGEVCDSNAQLAERADLIVLAVKPYQLDAVAGEIAGTARRVMSVLGGTSVESSAPRRPRCPTTSARCSSGSRTSRSCPSA